MTVIDFAAIAIILLFLARGIWAGFSRQLASLAGLILGYIFAGRYYEQISPKLSFLVSSPPLRFLLTYVLLFLAVFLAAVALGIVLKKVMSLSLLGWFDRTLGGLFGLVKAGLVVSVCFMVLSGILADSNPMLTGSFTAPYLRKSSDFLLSFVADHDLRRHLIPKTPALAPLKEPVPAGQPFRRDSAKKAK